MHDPSGAGWLQHAVYGTSRALVASGPSHCLNGPSRNFFIQARTFEICRSVIFNEPSFLTEPEWMDLTLRLRNSNGSLQQPSQSALLDLVVKASKLRVSLQQLAKETATEAFQLHDNLAIWDLEDSAMSFGHDKDFDDEQHFDTITKSVTDKAGALLGNRTGG
ncbi:unnamed protein product [Parascedosporium putredinis]|uniref:Uncharacterized protein n=1 Tax=Parascedosporium putredinis TaxID=1442378 RepID=A0A9P1GZR2_9PEZI|nr:unnamed protein product [Parascedosporium putredinis]CAI7993152.1 unnamed protein product [Parascedosporium putredinis]